MKVTTDFTVSGNYILPGATYSVDIPIPGAPSPSSHNAIQQSLIISAVLFDDRSSDGDSKIVAQIEERWLGEKTQLNRILSLLQGILDSPDMDVPAALGRLKAQASSLHPQSRNNISARFENGLDDGKERVLRDIEELENKGQGNEKINIREELLRMKEHYERLISRL